MKIRSLIVILSVFCLTGCIQSKEHLVINEDGSGTMETEIMMPQGTIQMFDMVMGQMMAAMQQAFAPEGGAQLQQPQQPSIADQLFTVDDILSKAKEAGAKVTLLDHKREVTDKGLYTQYKIQFDDIEKLLASEGMSMKMKIYRGADGGWVCETEPDPEEAAKSKGQLEDVKNYKNSEEYQSMDPMMQAMMMEGFKDMRFEFLISAPGTIADLSGGFERVDAKTARLFFGGDVFNDPTLLDKLYGLSANVSKVVWNSSQTTGGLPAFVREGPMPAPQVLSIKPFKEEVPSPSDPEVPSVEQETPSGFRKVFLNNGKHFEGKIVEENSELIRMEIDGITITFYRDQITRIER